MKRFLLLMLAMVLSSTHAALPIQSWTLSNGARVLFVENHSIPIIDLSIEFDAGSRRDPQGKSGVASLTGGMLARGLKVVAKEPALSEAQISDAFADTAAQLGGSASSDRAGASLRTLSSQQESQAAILLLARILAQPSFPEAVLAREKTRSIAAIREAETKPDAIAGKAFFWALYGAHPYANKPTAESVQSIVRDDLLSFHRTHYVADRAVIAIVGDVTKEQADAIAQQLTVRLSTGKSAALPPMAEVVPVKAAEIRIAHPASQSHILIGMPSLVRSDPDYFALTVGNYILGGGGFVSRLMHEVREKRGLTYGITSSFNPKLQKGPFQIGLQTQKSQTDEALKITRETLAAFLRDGPTDAELKAAKDNLIGGFGLRIDNNRKILDSTALIGYYGLPLDYLDTWTANIEKVSKEEIRAAFQRKIALDQMTTVIVGAPE